MNHCPVSLKPISPPVTHPSAWCSAAIDALPDRARTNAPHLPRIDRAQAQSPLDRLEAIQSQPQSKLKPSDQWHSL